MPSSIFALVALASTSAFAQQPGLFVAPPVARQSQPPVDIRRVAAEQPLPNSSKPALRLAPRSQSSDKTVRKPAAPSPTGALATVGGSLAIVLGLFVVIAWCARHFSPSGAQLLPKEAVELLGRTSLAARQQAHLVRVGNKLLLVAISAAGTETLTEITDPSEVEHLTALCRRGQAGSSTAAFRQALQQFDKEPAPRGFIEPPRATVRGGGR